MQSFQEKNNPQTVILRHRKENLKKCSLTGLESRADMLFLTYPAAQLPCFKGYLLLAVDAPVLTPDDADCGLYLIDATWRYAEKMLTYSESKQPLVKRSLPGTWKTAYPRKQDDCPLPDQGLASVEALFAAYQILGRDTTGLLNHYYWKEQFLQLNSH